MCLCVKPNLRESKTFLQIKPSVSVKQILQAKWEIYELTHELREVEEREVKKALRCYGHDNGCFVYICKQCGEYIFQSLGCNSRICSNCGKRYADQWAISLSKSMFKIPHRHFVISVPDVIWPYLKEDRGLWKSYMDSAIETCNDYFPNIMRNPPIRVGIIAILHPYGKDMKFQPHLHLIVTEGGFNPKGYFVSLKFIPARKFAKCWQYHVSAKLQKEGLPNGLFSYTYAKYDGFYVWVHKDGTIHHPRLIAKYLGRYVRHPAIANSRIDYFDGNNVGFHYDDHEDSRHNVIMTADEFISALIQHIPEPQFKMIRYYGAYARKTKAKFGLASQSSIRQWTLLRFGFYKEIKCPYCGGEVEFVAYINKPPPEEIKSQKELTDWISLNVN